MPKSLEKLDWDQHWHWDNLKPPHGIPYSRYPILLPIYSCRIQYPLALGKVQRFSQLPEVQNSLGNVRVASGLSGSRSKQE